MVDSGKLASIRSMFGGTLKKSTSKMALSALAADSTQLFVIIAPNLLLLDILFCS